MMQPGRLGGGGLAALTASVTPAGAAGPESPTGTATAPLSPMDGGNATAMQDIHDIKPVLALSDGLGWQAWALVVAVLMLLAALAWWLWKRRKAPEIAAPAKPPVPADREAYQALDALAADNGVTPKQFYFRLSAVIRRYMERRFEFPAAEMTTEELLPQVDRLPMKQELGHELKAFCRWADPVKFADAPVDAGRLPRDLAFARDFVRQTTTVEVPEDGAPSGEPPDAPRSARMPDPAPTPQAIAWDKSSST